VPEACDDSIIGDGEGCSANCMSVLPTWICNGGNSFSSDNCSPIYGDGIIVGPEVCDDGNTSPGDGCSATGQVENLYECLG